MFDQITQLRAVIAMQAERLKLMPIWEKYIKELVLHREQQGRAIGWQHERLKHWEKVVEAADAWRLNPTVETESALRVATDVWKDTDHARERTRVKRALAERRATPGPGHNSGKAVGDLDDGTGSATEIDHEFWQRFEGCAELYLSKAREAGRRPRSYRGSPDALRSLRGRAKDAAG